MASFPSIRAPLRDAWSSTAPDGVRRTSMDSGPSKRRASSTAIAARERLRFKLDEADFALLADFYAAEKASRFDLDHWVWGNVEAAFDAPPTYTHSGRWWIVDVALEVWIPPAEED